MPSRRRGPVVAVVVLLLAATVGAGVTTAATSAAGTPALTQTADDTIVQTQRYALVPDELGTVAVTLSYAVPDRVTELQTYVPADATVTDTDGFDRVNETEFRWDGRTERATIDIRYDPNRTTQQTGLEAAPGEYLFADAGSWALVQRVRTPTEWRYTGTGGDPVTFERTLATAGPGYAGDRMVYLGAVTTAERRVDGQTIRLVVPERADPVEARADILDSLGDASASLSVGDRDERVLAFVAPTDGVDWGVRGLELGGSEFWVRDAEPLDTPSNVWLHEYVHTRQAFATTERTRWLTEGTAVYYAALLTLEQGRIDFERFREFLALGARSRYADVVLAEPPTWTANAEYVKGPLVAGRIDEAIRGGDGATFEAVFARLNAADDRVTQAQLLDAVAATGGADARSRADRDTTTTEPVSTWNATTHRRLFGPLPAAVGSRLPENETGYRVDGPYRNGTVEPTDVRLVTGETLTVRAVVENTGDEPGTYNATLTVDGAAVASATGDIAGTAERVVPLSHRFDRPGTYAVAVGDESVPVVVASPAAPTVTDVAVASETVRRGEGVVLTATVRNDAAIPANGTVVVSRNGTAVDTRVVSLAPETTTQFSVTVPALTTGPMTVAAGTETATVTVVDPTTGGSGPGFGALLALLVVVLVVGARSR